MIKQHILIVEDEILIAKEISHILEQEGYATEFGITTVEEAKKALSNNNFCLVLIDINLCKQSDGIELGNYLLRLDTIPYIYITSYIDNIILQRIKESRPHGIIVKPFKPSDIKAVISIVLNNYKYKKIDITRSEALITDEAPFMLKGVINYIDNNLENRIEINNLSDMTPWSNQHFIRVFAKYIGYTPYQYILKKKMEKSKILITETNMLLKDIAFELGYLSYGNFCKLFKREVGLNPEKYRKSNYVKRYLTENISAF